jgi:broad-specificity NMP kinase
LRLEQEQGLTSRFRPIAKATAEHSVRPTSAEPKRAARNGETTMRRVLLTGMSGTGKSSVIAELKRRGFAAIDMDEPAWSVRDAEGHQLWCEERLREVLAAEHAGPVFVSGCAENQVKFYPQFSHIVLMSAPADVIKERLASRTDNHYGKRPDELAEVLHHLEWVEPLLRRSATHEIVTTMPLDRVVATVLSLAQASD